jgi:hypothetical protein
MKLTDKQLKILGWFVETGGGGGEYIRKALGDVEEEIEILYKYGRDKGTATWTPLVDWWYIHGTSIKMWRVTWAGKNLFWDHASRN